MSLSPETQQRLVKAEEKQFTNPRNKETLQIIANRAFVGMMGPFRTGKTAVSLMATQLDPEHFHFVPSTTNEQVAKILDDTTTGNLVQYVIHPTDGTLYGTYPNDYQPDKHNLMPLLVGEPADYVLGSPFEKAQAIGIFTDPNSLEQRITTSYRDKPPEKLENRLIEGITSAQFLIERHKAGKLSLLHNVEGELEKSAQALIDLVNGDRESDGDGVAYLERTIHMFEKMLRDLATNGETK